MVFAKEMLRVREDLCNNFKPHVIQKKSGLVPFEKEMIRDLV